MKPGRRKSTQGCALTCLAGHCNLRHIRSARMRETAAGTAPVQQLQQRGDEEVHRVRVLIHQEAEPAEEVHDAADARQQGLPRAGRLRRAALPKGAACACACMSDTGVMEAHVHVGKQHQASCLALPSMKEQREAKCPQQLS